MKKVTNIFIFSFILLNLILIFSILKKVEATSNLFRIQVIANSNENKDQDVKIQIAKKIEQYIIENNIDEENINKKNLDNILAIANEELDLNNMDYTAYIKYGKVYTKEKSNNYISLPSGSYKSIQVILGEGNGKNFWSIIFPNEINISRLEPLETLIPGISKMYVDSIEYKNTDVNEYEDKDKDEDDIEIKYSFKILELFGIK